MTSSVDSIFPGVGDAFDFLGTNFFGGAEKQAGRDMKHAGLAGEKLIRERFGETEKLFNPFIQQGGAASQLLTNYSGAGGVDAQRLAFQNFQESPATQFLRQQGLRGVESEAAVTGGLGSGDRLRRLTEFSQGLALQDLNRQQGLLGGIADTGFNASTNLAGLGEENALNRASALSGAALGGATGDLLAAGQKRNFVTDVFGAAMGGLGGGGGATRPR